MKSLLLLAVPAILLTGCAGTYVGADYGPGYPGYYDGYDYGGPDYVGFSYYNRGYYHHGYNHYSSNYHHGTVARSSVRSGSVAHSGRVSGPSGGGHSASVSASAGHGGEGGRR